MKSLSPLAIEHVLKAIELENEQLEKKKEAYKTGLEAVVGSKREVRSLLESKLDEKCLVNLRIEDVRLAKRTCHALAYWMKKSNFLQTFGFSKVKFEHNDDFRQVMESVALNKKIQTLSFHHMTFSTEQFGKSIG